ncbi:MAG: glutamine amidotransferase [Thermodesulfobacteriota bacterium]
MSWLEFAGTLSLRLVWPAWLLALVVMLSAGLLVWQYHRLKRHLPTRRAVLLSCLRGVVLAILIFFAFDPSLLVSKTENLKPKLAILVDTSQSMALEEANNKSRLEGAKDILTQGEVPLLDRLTEKYDVSLYSFAEGLRSLDAGELTALNARGRASDLISALFRIGDSGRLPRPALALILSDGKIRWDGEAEKLLSRLEVPLWTVPLANLADYKDLAITEVRVPDLAFRDKPVRIDFTIKGYGYAGTSVSIVLKRKEKLLARTSAHINKDRFQGSLSLSFVPHELGQYQLSLAMPLKPGERVSANNSVNILINVLRDKIRVLMVSGKPSFGYRFLRAALKGDPSIDLLSFVILRTPTDVMNVRQNEQALIPFPVDTLFDKELTSFDLVVFDNFSYISYFGTPYLENIKEFVKRGGAFAMLGGDKSFGDGGYGRTPLEEIMPLAFPAPSSYQPAELGSLQLTKAGKEHPLTRLVADKEENVKLWLSLPAIDGYNRLEPAGRGTVLVTARPDIPILAVANVGQGRTLALTTDYAWNWYMGRVAKGQSNQPYLRLMTQMVRWLVKDPGLSMLGIEPARPAGVNEESQIKVKLRQEVGSEAVRLTGWVTDPEGVRNPLDLRPSGLGQYAARFTPDKEGIYSFKVELRAKGQLLEQAEAKQIISSASGEFVDPAPDPDLLSKLAQLSGGRFVDNSRQLGEIMKIDRQLPQTRLIEQRRLPLWGTPFALAFVLVILSLEWFLRRRWGLI